MTIAFPNWNCAKTLLRWAAMPGWIGLPELLILLVVVLLVFGPKRLPEMGRSLGKGMREFKDSVTGNDKDDDEHAPAAQLTAAPQDVVETTPQRENETVS
jgi:sec-independent protein translocase protein TatA